MRGVQDLRAVEGDSFLGLGLVIASLWPLSILHGILFWSNWGDVRLGAYIAVNGPWASLVFFLAALFQLVLSRLIINHIVKGHRHRFLLENWIPKDEQVADHVLAYVLPFVVSPQELDSTKGVAYGVFLVGFMYVLWYCNLYHLNPAVLANGYRLFEAEDRTQEGEPMRIWVLAKGPRPNGFRSCLVQVTPILWIEAEPD